MENQGQNSSQGWEKWKTLGLNNSHGWDEEKTNGRIITKDGKKRKPRDLYLAVKSKSVRTLFFRYSQQQQQQVAGGGQMPLGAHPMMAAWHRGYMENGESTLLVNAW